MEVDDVEKEDTHADPLKAVRAGGQDVGRVRTAKVRVIGRLGCLVPGKSL